MMHSIAYNGMGRRSTPVSDMNQAKVSYTRITCTFLRLSKNAVLIGKGGAEHWIPRSVIHGADDRHLDMHTEYENIYLRVMDWKVRELGL